MSTHPLQLVERCFIGAVRNGNSIRANFTDDTINTLLERRFIMLYVNKFAVVIIYIAR